MPHISYSSSYDRIVFLFDEAVIILPRTASSGEGYLFLFAVAIEMIINELSARVTSVVPYKIYLNKARLFLIPLSKGSDRDLVFEQCSRFSVRSVLERVLLPLMFQETINGGRADVQEFVRGSSSS
jgi:hypothetical protein